MTQDEAQTFKERLRAHLSKALRDLTTERGDWLLRGILDLRHRLYPIPSDTKVLSRLLEMLFVPPIFAFAHEQACEIILAPHQNYYPDITFITSEGTKFAVDIKSTYRLSEHRVSGFTLGAFTGYFRDPHLSKNTLFPYEAYAEHFILGLIYSRPKKPLPITRIYTLDDLQTLLPVVQQLQVILHEKWRVASDRPGSGNTRNIGSVREVKALIHGRGPFTQYGERGKAIFLHYWRNYLTAEMARTIASPVPYRSLEEYWTWLEERP